MSFSTTARWTERSAGIITTQLSTVTFLISYVSLYCENATLKHNTYTIHVIKNMLRLHSYNFKLSWELFSWDCYFPNKTYAQKWIYFFNIAKTEQSDFYRFFVYESDSLLIKIYSLGILNWLFLFIFTHDSFMNHFDLAKIHVQISL